MSGRLLFFTHLSVLFSLRLEMLVSLPYLNQRSLADWSLPAVLMWQMFKTAVGGGYVSGCLMFAASSAAGND